jgi:ATP-dependent DNA helicase RecG
MAGEITAILKQLNELDECENIEAKRSADELGKSALETISAFSNEPGLGGGTILFGISEREYGYVASGVEDPGKLTADLASQCASAFNRPVRPRIVQETVDGRTVIAAITPEAAPAEKPIFIASRGMHYGSYRRIAATDQRATEDDLRTLFHAAVGEAFEDSTVAGAAIDDLDPEVIAAYRRGLLDANPGTELRNATDEQLVLSVGGAVRRDGTVVPTVAGVLLFGKVLSLRRLFPASRVDYVRVPGTTWVPDPNQRFDTVEIRAPLLTAFRRAYAAASADVGAAVSVDAPHDVARDRIHTTTWTPAMARSRLRGIASRKASALALR